MYNRFGRRTKRISDSKIVDLRSKRRVTDADDDDEVIEESEEALKNLTKEEIQGLLELLPYKDALIKIAKGEFEIEKVEEVEEDEDTDTDADAEGAEAEEENFEEDEDFNEDADTSEDDDEDADYDEYADADDEPLEDSAEKRAIWEARLKGNDN